MNDVESSVGSALQNASMSGSWRRPAFSPHFSVRASSPQPPLVSTEEKSATSRSTHCSRRFRNDQSTLSHATTMYHWNTWQQSVSEVWFESLSITIHCLRDRRITFEEVKLRPPYHSPWRSYTPAASWISQIDVRATFLFDAVASDRSRSHDILTRRSTFKFNFLRTVDWIFVDSCCAQKSIHDGAYSVGPKISEWSKLP